MAFVYHFTSTAHLPCEGDPDAKGLEPALAPAAHAGGRGRSTSALGPCRTYRTRRSTSAYWGRADELRTSR
jgi:hypothetical protein